MSSSSDARPGMADSHARRPDRRARAARATGWPRVRRSCSTSTGRCSRGWAVTYREIAGADVAATLTDFARRENATQLVLGASGRSRWAELVRGSVINDVLHRARGLDVHVISEAGDQARPRRASSVGPPAPPGRLHPASAHRVARRAGRRPAPHAHAGQPPGDVQPAEPPAPVPPPRGRGGGDRRHRTGGRRRDPRVALRQLVLHATVPPALDRPRGERAGPRGVPRRRRARERPGAPGVGASRGDPPLAAPRWRPCKRRRRASGRRPRPRRPRPSCSPAPTSCGSPCCGRCPTTCARRSRRSRRRSPASCSATSTGRRRPRSSSWARSTRRAIASTTWSATSST